MMDHLMDIATQQLVAIARTTAYHCDEQHEYMKGAGGTDWFPHKWVVEAMRAAVTIRNTQAEDMVREELHQARAHLGEAHALLQRSATDIRDYANDYPADHSERARLHAMADVMQALSASAEPEVKS